MRFEKERYTPYTTVSGVFICEEEMGEIGSVRVFLDGGVIHYGPVDSFESYVSGNIRYASFTSHGFSMALSQNQPKPGLSFSVSLDGLMTSNIVLPNVTWEENTQTAGYIFVKENSSMWDAVVALCRKLNGGYPYISGANEVRFTRESDIVTNVYKESAVKWGFGSSYTGMVSHYHMKDTEDNYSISYENPAAAQREIVRHKYINLDRQWLDSGEEGLHHKSRFAAKGYRYSFIKYAGRAGEDIRRLVTYDGQIAGQAFGVKEVSRLRIDYGKSGLFTTLWFYEDEYAQNV